MKILHLYSGNLYGGIERLLGAINRLQALYPALQHEFGLCFRKKLWDELASQGATVHDLGEVRARYPWTVLLARRKLATVVQQARPDWVICHTPWPHAIFGGMLRRQGVKFATWFHDVPHANNWLDRWAARSPAELMFATSQYVLAGIPSVFRSPTTTVLHCPAELNNPTLSRLQRLALREQLGVKPGEVVLFQASRLEPWKGLHVFVDALTRMQKVPGWTAWLAGGPQKAGEEKYLAELQNLARNGGLEHRLKFLGWRSDVPQLMQAADVFCQPNTGPEPFGLVFTEALSSGVPVVATNIGGAKEIVTPECGLLVPPGDAAAVSEALTRLVVDEQLRKSLGLAGPARARELVDPFQQLSRLHQLLESASQPHPELAISRGQA